MRGLLLSLIVAVTMSLPHQSFAQIAEDLIYNPISGQFQANVRGGLSRTVPAIPTGSAGLAIVASGTGGSSVIGPVNTCASPTVTSTQTTWTKFSNGQMFIHGFVSVETNNANASCNTSIVVTLPQAFNGRFHPTCAVGQRNSSTGTASQGGDCKLAIQSSGSGTHVPANTTLRMIGQDFVTWTGGNMQQIDFFFQAWGPY